MNRWMAVALIALAACSARQEEEEAPRLIDGDLETWEGSVQPEGGSSVRGSVTARTAWIQGGPGSTAAAITINGAQSGAHHPWHIHRGTCGSGGPIVGEPGAYPVLHVGADGRATARAALGVGLDPNQAYYVNVHRAPDDLGTIVACGAIDD